MITQNGIAYIIVVRCLDVIEKDDVFQFDRIADDAVGAYKCRAADKCAMPHFRIRPYDARPAQIS